MLNTELGLTETFLKALERRDKYELKISNEVNRNKYIVKVAEEKTRLGIGFVSEIKRMSDEMGLITTNLEVECYNKTSNMYRTFIARRHTEEMKRQAVFSGNRIVYATLSHRPNYFKEKICTEDKGNIFKARAGLMNEGWIPYVTGDISCRYCKEIKERTDTFHIIGRCKELREIRKKSFGIESMKILELRKHLNCNWRGISTFVRELKTLDA